MSQTYERRTPVMIMADKITLQRKKNGWSQEELAERLDVSRQSVSKWGDLSVQRAGNVRDKLRGTSKNLLPPIRTTL